MKKIDLPDINQARKELADLILDKNTKKLKDVKAIFKKRKEIARIMTMLKQKQLVGKLEGELEVSKK